MKQLEDKRVWLGGGGLIAALIVAVAWFMFIGPQRSSADDYNAEASATHQQNAVLEAKVHALQEKRKHLDTYTASLKSALAALPFDSGLPAFTRQLSAQGTANGVKVTSVVVGGITPVGAPAAAVAPVGDSTSPAPTGTTSTTAPTAAVAGGLFSVAVTLQTNGTLAQQLAFLKTVQTAGPRRALVNSAQVTPGTGAKEASIDGVSSFTTSLTVFSAPQTPAQIAQMNNLLAGKIGN
jgi:hypothetical protein